MAGKGRGRVSRKTAVFSVLFLLLALGAVMRLLPGSPEQHWRQVFSTFGIGNFSDCADSCPASLHVLDVGKADSILVESDGKFLLVDGGTPDRGEEVVSYLKRRGVKKLDAVVNTHPDEDHVGGLKYVIDSFSVSRYFAPRIPAKLIPGDSAYRNTQEALKSKRLIPEVPGVGKQFSVGNWNVRVLGPIRPGKDTNNNSIVLLLTYRNTRFLLMGDAEDEEERDLLASGQNLSADVLKVGHHGSNTSTTQPFLNAVKPKIAAISVGWDTNKLPKKETLNRLFDAHTTIYRTDVSGTLIFLTDGNKITVKTQK